MCHGSVTSRFSFKTSRLMVLNFSFLLMTILVSDHPRRQLRRSLSRRACPFRSVVCGEKVATRGTNRRRILRLLLKDAFRSNFLVQWHPESILVDIVSRSKPRVYIIDFEVAVQFPTECSSHERLCTWIPCGGSMTDPTQYCRPCIPEMPADIPYDPFKLDVWQLGSHFHTAFDVS
jgi:hypothetical protein